MKKVRSYILTGIGLLVLAGALVLSGTNNSSAKTPDDVVVVNTPTNPVPTQAQGTTTVAGTVQAQQAGAWSVGLAGTPTVKIGNTDASPVLVRDVENPAKQPYMQVLTFSIPDGMLQGDAILTVPAGKHFVIEYISGLSSFNSLSFGGPVTYGALNSDIGGLVYVPFNPPTANGTCVAGQLVRAYVFESAQVFVERAGLTGAQQVKVSVTGYLVNTP